MMFRGKLSIGKSGPSCLSISLRMLMSFWFIAPIRGAVIVYVMRKIMTPMIKIIQLDKNS